MTEQEFEKLFYKKRFSNDLTVFKNKLNIKKQYKLVEKETKIVLTKVLIEKVAKIINKVFYGNTYRIGGMNLWLFLLK